jgi:hypothetical protein
MTEEQAFALANPDGGVYAPGAFVLALGGVRCPHVLTGLGRESAPMIAAISGGRRPGEGFMKRKMSWARAKW